MARDWYGDEVPTRIAMVAELQRMVRRARARPVPVVIVAALLTAAICYRVATKPNLYTADVVLAVNQGAMSSERDQMIPFDALKDYVAVQLLPDNELVAVLDQISPGRTAKLGRTFALEQLREQLEVRIWKNSFVYYDEANARAQKSARIGLEVIDQDPERAFAIARALGGVVVRRHEELRRRVSARISEEIAVARDAMEAEIDRISLELSRQHTAYDRAVTAGNRDLAASAQIAIAALTRQRIGAQTNLATIVASREGSASQATAAGLDTTIEIASQVRPEPAEGSWFALALMIAIIGTGSLIGSVIVLGAFDARIHDIDDVDRLGLPVVGHLPSFAGDDVGTLASRGAGRRAGVPWWRRWRFR